MDKSALVQIDGFGVWSELVAAWLPQWKPERNKQNLCDWEDERHSSGMPFAITALKAGQLLNMLGTGSFLAPSLRAALITPPTFVTWMKNGGSLKYKTEIDRNDAIEPYRTFSMMVDVAEGLPEHAALQTVTGSGDWRAQAWFLERRYRQRWGKDDAAALAKSVGVGQGGGSAIVIMIPDNGRDGLLDEQSNDMALPEGLDDANTYDTEAERDYNNSVE